MDTGIVQASSGHRCLFCGLPIHAICGCQTSEEQLHSRGMGELVEGFNSPRVCSTCYRNRKSSIREEKTVNLWDDHVAGNEIVLRPVEMPTRREEFSEHVSPQGDNGRSSEGICHDIGATAGEHTTEEQNSYEIDYSDLDSDYCPDEENYSNDEEQDCPFD